MNAVDEGIVPPEPEGGDNAEVTQVADNPAWNDFLSVIPASMHDMVKPHLAKWDEGVNQRINQVHSEWADFKPFREAGVTSEQLNQAYGIFQAINDNPQEVYRILGETYGYANQQPQVEPVAPQQGQVNPQQQTNQPTGDEYEVGQGGQFNPEMARLQAMTENMAQIILAQERQRQEQAEDAALDAELKAAHEKHGDFNEEFVLRYMGSGMSTEQAVGAYNSMLNQVRSDANRPVAPTVITGSGPLPSNQINPSNLNGKDTRALVAQMFKAANQQG